MKYTVYARGERIDFESELTSEAAVETLENIIKPSEFATSLVNQYRMRGLSDRQRYWMIKLAQDEINKISNMDKLGTYKATADLFNSIPLVRFRVRLDDLTLKKAGPNSRNPNCVYVFDYDAPGGDNGNYMGKILPDGTLVSSRLDIERVYQLDAFNSNPIENVIKYGKETGQCSCCGRSLSDPISVHGGIGPVCLERIAGKQARKIMQESFAASDNLIECLARAGLLKTELKEEDGLLPALERGKFQSDHDFQLASAIGKL